VLVGVFSTWTTVGAVTLNGTQGPNNGGIEGPRVSAERAHRYEAKYSFEERGP
jgi:hypothetical protein